MNLEKFKKIKVAFLVFLFLILVSVLLFALSETGKLRKEVEKLNQELQTCQTQTKTLEKGQVFLKVAKIPAWYHIHVQLEGTWKGLTEDGKKMILEKDGQEIQLNISPNVMVLDTSTNLNIYLSDLKIGDNVMAVAVLERGKEFPTELDQLEFVHVYKLQ